MAREKKGVFNKLCGGSLKAIVAMFAWEMVEEGLENAIAYFITSAFALFVTKTLSALAIVGATQAIKVSIKRYLLPVVKTLTYKEGDDKMKKFKEFLNWLNANKFTLIGAVSGALIAFSGSGVIDVNDMPALMAGSVNLTPIIYYVVLGALTVVASFFPEKVADFVERVNAANAKKEIRKAEKATEKEEKEIRKVALKELSEEKKVSEKSKTSEEELKAKEEKERLEREYRAKIEAEKAKILAQTASENKTTEA